MTPKASAKYQVTKYKVPSTKVIRNGLLFIERNGKVYTAQGAEIR